MKTYLRGIVGTVLVLTSLWVAIATHNVLLGVALFGACLAGAMYTAKRWGL